MQIVGSYISYRIIKLLSTPFKKWDAYKLGIIDENGNTIRKPISSDEKRSFGFFQKIIRKIKQITISTAGKSRAAAIWASLQFLKEHVTDTDFKIIIEYCIEEDILTEEIIKTIPQPSVFQEEFNKVLGNLGE